LGGKASRILFCGFIGFTVLLAVLRRLFEQRVKNLHHPFQSLWIGLEAPLDCHVGKPGGELVTAAVGLYVYRCFEDHSDGDAGANFNLLDGSVSNRVQVFEEFIDRGAEDEISQILLGPASLGAVELHIQQHLGPGAEDGLAIVDTQPEDLAETHSLALANEELSRRR
jgi:hypothetical protein